MARGWFVIQVYTGFENSVYHKLVAKKNIDALKDVLLDARVPEEDYTVEKKNKKVIKKRKIYPGYVLVELDLPEDDSIWKKIYAEIKSINGVGMFLNAGGGNKRPEPLNYEEVKSIFERTGDIKTDLAKLESGFELGERVRIGEGPFKDFEGEVEAISQEKNSLTVRVEIFGRLTPVELGFNQVHKI
ncbi:MAG: transcription termination/antitermination factor NusG [Spirochaetes bacterium GWF1_51_8]|nr:MAG: transcription termination/antitermination factor NusG [Spirochaetes bacterium GWF1_51_8]